MRGARDAQATAELQRPLCVEEGEAAPRAAAVSPHGAERRRAARASALALGALCAALCAAALCAAAMWAHASRAIPPPSRLRAAEPPSAELPFGSAPHPWGVNAEWGAARRPFPTNAWWVNLAVSDNYVRPGEMPAVPLPYAVRNAAGRGLEVSYGVSRRALTPKFQGDYFGADVVIGVDGGAPHAHEVVHADELTLGLRLTAARGAAFVARLARGAPWVVTEWSGAADAAPCVGSEQPLLSVQPLEEAGGRTGGGGGAAAAAAASPPPPHAPMPPPPSPSPSPSPAARAPAAAAAAGPAPRGAPQPAAGSAMCSAHAACAVLALAVSDGLCCPLSASGAMLPCCDDGGGGGRAAIAALELEAQPDAGGGRAGPARLFRLRLGNGQRWLLATAHPVVLEWSAAPARVRLPAGYGGALRLALAADDGSEAALAAGARGPYAVGGRVRAEPGGGGGGGGGGEDDGATLTYEWDVAGGDASELVSLALGHHADALLGGGAAGGVPLAAPRFDSMKGSMTAVRGGAWSVRVPLSNLTWASAGSAALGADAALSAPVRAALHADLGQPDVVAPGARDPYFYGKGAARLARLALIAEELGETAAQRRAASALSASLGAWLRRGGPDGAPPLVWDSTYGGLVSRASLSSDQCLGDFGNGRYNDHHFHYGYTLYAAAVACRNDAAFCEEHRAHILELALDIASPPAAEGEARARRFPTARHAELYDWHSWASGLYPMANGRQQESSSEAVNGYYGAVLAAEALGEGALARWARLLLSLELRGAQTYWQVPEHSAVYAPAFVAAQRMVGIVSALDVNVATWFGWQSWFVHGINVLPVTPATEALLPARYAAQQFEQLRPDLEQMPDEWRAFALAVQGINEPEAALRALQAGVRKYDDGNTRTNMLHWLSARIAARAAPARR